MAFVKLWISRSWDFDRNGLLLRAPAVISVKYPLCGFLVKGLEVEDGMKTKVGADVDKAAKDDGKDGE